MMLGYYARQLAGTGGLQTLGADPSVIPVDGKPPREPGTESEQGVEQPG